MCLGVPMRLVSIEDREGTVEIGGIRRRVRLDLTPEARAGEFVIIHAGYAIQILDEAAAAETLALLKELGEVER